jgi:hypothetical protein
MLPQAGARARSPYFRHHGFAGRHTKRAARHCGCHLWRAGRQTPCDGLAGKARASSRLIAVPTVVRTVKERLEGSLRSAGRQVVQEVENRELLGEPYLEPGDCGSVLAPGAAAHLGNPPTRPGCFATRPSDAASGLQFAFEPIEPPLQPIVLSLGLFRLPAQPLLLPPGTFSSLTPTHVLVFLSPVRIRSVSGTPQLCQNPQTGTRSTR